MTPAETLTAARLSPVGPFVQARPKWLEVWCGPVAPIDGVAAVIVGPDRRPANMRHGPWLCASHDGEWPGGTGLRSCRLDEIRLDLRRPEVRDRLVRCGCPSWARDELAAVWAWANGVEARVLPPWVADGKQWVRWNIVGFEATSSVSDLGWIHSVDGWADERHGPETGADGRACADLAALRAGCVLEEADGWYVPGDTIGWWPKNLETP